jgi:phospholipid-binding lipoprotein MlaA
MLLEGVFMKVFLRAKARTLSMVILFCLPLPGMADEGRQDDPHEAINRAVFAFNDTADKWVLKPIARAYRYVTPDPVERGVSRMFGNVGELPNVANDVLQGKVAQAGNDFGRFLINSTIGVAGIFDVAQHWGMKESEGEDFGQTFAVWGANPGAYIVLPLFGPSNYRDAPGRVFDALINPISFIDHVPTRNQIIGASILSGRADLLEAEKLISGDKYSFVRDVYIQRREHLVMDGLVEDDFGDDDY